MTKLFVKFLLSTCLVAPALSQSLVWEPIPAEDLAGFDRYLATADFGDPSGDLTDSQIARRLSQIYRQQSQLLVARADGDRDGASDVLRSMLGNMEELSEQPGIAEDGRYRELYRSVVTEHDEYALQSLERDFDDLFAMRAVVFEESGGYRTASVTRSGPKPIPVATTIPMTDHQHVDNLRDWFLLEKRSLLIRWMGRADTLFPMIETILEEEGLPDELKYLSVIESGLNPRAYSSAHAVGLWQFIRATGSAYGLEVDRWVDERMDFEKATRAAARHLKDLYRQYDNNWHVAMAGYNCSPRCIQRAIRANGGEVDFWGMYRHLNSQTRGYIPQFIAVAQILSNPGEFGLPQSLGGKGLAYDVVPVKGMLPLVTVARLAGTTTTEIKRLNPALQSSTLPPGSVPYDLRIPEGKADRFVEAFDALPEEDRTYRSTGEYVVRRGDNLSSIGSRLGVSVSYLKRSNNLRSSRIYPGQRLKLPGRGSEGGIATLVASGVHSVDWGNRTLKPIKLDIEPSQPLMASGTGTTPIRAVSTSTRNRASTQPAQRSTSTSSSTVRHRVRRGDTLSGLASRHNTTVAAIRSANGLRSNRIYRGQVLSIQPGAGRSARVHVVQRGENLVRIAERYGTTVSQIRASNSLRSTVIHPGQRLTIDSQ